MHDIETRDTALYKVGDQIKWFSGNRPMTGRIQSIELTHRDWPIDGTPTTAVILPTPDQWRAVFVVNDGQNRHWCNEGQLAGKVGA